MPLKIANLRRLLQLYYLPPNRLQSELRKDIRQEIGKLNGRSGGPDFHTPFWSDAKNHVSGKTNLREETAKRVQSNKRSRGRLYPQLTEGFLRWWDEKRRWRNEEIEILDHVSARFRFEELDATIKVENLLPVRVEGQFHRLVYPYFSEDPTLSDEAARVGLWLMGEALPDYPSDDLRILDVLRGASWGTVDVKMAGDERQTFASHYNRVSTVWERLWKEYR